MSFSESLQPHQQRVVQEHRDLTEKINKLGAFIEGPLFLSVPPAERARLACQKAAMCCYAEVLEQRICAFGE